MHYPNQPDENKKNGNQLTIIVRVREVIVIPVTDNDLSAILAFTKGMLFELPNTIF